MHHCRPLILYIAALLPVYTVKYSYQTPRGIAWQLVMTHYRSNGRIPCFVFETSGFISRPGDRLSWLKNSRFMDGKVCSTKRLAGLLSAWSWRQCSISKTSVTSYPTTQHHIPEDRNPSTILFYTYTSFSQKF
jgi:hypothetical protein